MQIVARIRQMAAPHWLALFSLVAAGWVLLYAMAVPADQLELAQIYGAEFWRSLCVVSPDNAGFWGLTAMWAIMSAAMMAPTALPALTTYDDMIASGAASKQGFAELIGGYLAIWLGFSFLAAGAQIGLYKLGLLSPMGQSVSVWLSGALLIGAGLYQFSALKDACLSKCRQPIGFFMQYWRDTRWNAVALGLRLGAVCLGCCWALMLLGFVGGVMNIAFMGLATLVMIFEKLPELGRHITKPLGWGLMILGLAIMTNGVLTLI
ncbi:DUF2182 domain-containing protein [Aliiroseovarius sp. KMU-50]|uniref:DUF2182 domain-containing protein n=1 Tax=Aliiroseovarius salicola TaxID=3009082 RepID=A0ABT4W2F2_9RHOB|nr:DUF2182 domain-containing protein [Aliiroseovarius sp. KMU-50]MDA5094689.1 DUF2182 domain-containing protein [Aliiroseovarius sp. KMU-50]